MDTEIWQAVEPYLPPRGIVLAPSGEHPGAIAAGRLRPTAPASADPNSVAAVLLCRDELSHAGTRAEVLLDEATEALEPGGVLIATLRNQTFAAAAHVELDGIRGFTASEAEELLHHQGFTIELICAPGAATRLRGDEATTYRPPGEPAAAVVNLEVDRQPGLLGAAPTLLAVARAPRSAQERSDVFFRTLPRKVVAAAVLCRDPAGRLLVVYDSFKRYWTIPGGVVDAEEEPAEGASRETLEEAGVEVEVTELLGVFASRWPDRLVFVFAAHADGDGDPTPIHTHEISAAAWLPLDEALARLAPTTAFKVRRCLETPYRSWIQ